MEKEQIKEDIVPPSGDCFLRKPPLGLNEVSKMCGVIGCRTKNIEGKTRCSSHLVKIPFEKLIESEIGE